MRTGKKFFIAVAACIFCAGMACETTLAKDEESQNSSSEKGLLFSGNVVADIAEQVAPSVVNLEMSRKIQAGAFPGAFFPGMPGGNMEFFFNGQKTAPGDPHVPPQFQEKRDTASGFIIRSDGYIVTNAHAVKNQDSIKVTLNDKRSFEAKIIGVDYFSDLAVVKIDAKNLPEVSMGSSQKLRPGEFAIAIGSPLGYDHTVTLGIISAVGRSVTDVNGNINFIQTDAAINPGNSGGPLLNLKGEVIGVNTAIRRDAQNIGFSIPIDVAKTVSAELIASGKISRPWLGIVMKELDESGIKSLNLPANSGGVLVSAFVQNSPGLASGLKANDVILKINNKEMNTPKDVKEFVQSRKVGDSLTFQVMRENAPQTVTVSVGSYPDSGDRLKLSPGKVH